MPESTIKYWLVFDWKDEDVRARKTKPSRSSLGTNELLVQGELKITKPEIEVPKLATELEIPEARIRRVVAEGMDLDEEIPQWWETVDEVLDNHGWMIEEDDPNAATIMVLKEDPGSPPVEAVMDRVRERMRQIQERDQ